MFPVMKYASKVNGLAFVLLMVVMLAYSLPRVVEFAEKEDQAVSLYLDGALSRKFEKSYDTQLFYVNCRLSTGQIFGTYCFLKDWKAY